MYSSVFGFFSQYLVFEIYCIFMFNWGSFYFIVVSYSIFFPHGKKINLMGFITEA